MLHEREVEAKTHAILMAFTMVRPRWGKAASVKINIETQPAHRRREFGFKGAFVVAVDDTVQLTKVLLDILVNFLELRIYHLDIFIMHLFCGDSARIACLKLEGSLAV